MRIEFPLLSILSLCLLAFFGLQGDVDLDSWEIGASITRDEVRLTVDPVFVILTDSPSCSWSEYYGLAFGNIVLMPQKTYGEDPLLDAYVLAHELNHVKQYRALGWWLYLAEYLIDIEPPKGTITDWNDSSQRDRTMWLPPIGWVNQWHFVRLSVNISKEDTVEYRGHSVRLIDDGTLDTVIEVDSHDYRFSQGYASLYRDKDGILTQTGKEVLFDEAVNAFEDDYLNEVKDSLVAKGF